MSMDAFAEREIRAAATLAARIAGCTCEPDVTAHAVVGVWHAHVAHNDFCPLVRGHAPPVTP